MLYNLILMKHKFVVKQWIVQLKTQTNTSFLDHLKS